MSARYSRSPTLRLRIARSTVATCLVVVHLLLAVIAVIEVSWRGYPQVALLLAMLSVFSGARAHYRMVAVTGLAWQGGEWTVDYAGLERPVTLRSGLCLPWVTWLQWHEAEGRVRHLFLFNDSAPRDALRRLRVRLQLQRRV